MNGLIKSAWIVVFREFCGIVRRGAQTPSVAVASCGGDIMGIWKDGTVYRLLAGVV